MIARSASSGFAARSRLASLTRQSTGLLPKETPGGVISRGTIEYDETGAPKHFTGVLVDITARKHAEQAFAGGGSPEE